MRGSDDKITDLQTTSCSGVEGGFFFFFGGGGGAGNCLTVLIPPSFGYAKTQCIV